MDPLTLLAQAKEKALAGDLDGARALREQAAEIKAINDMEAAAKAATKAATEAARLPFATEAAEDEPAAPQDIAVKSWYVRKYGDEAAALEQVMTELYGRNHQHTAWAKSADFMRYIRSGRKDDKLAGMVVYTPAQVAGALADGVSVAEIKATQVESQDTLGGLTARFN